MWDLDVSDIRQYAATGRLPAVSVVDGVLERACERALQHHEGKVADYIPALADADPEVFGIAITETNGRTHQLGSYGHVFSIQSISKVFVYALVCEALGHEEVLTAIGVNATGLPFNSVMALELNGGHPLNPMVNAGAIATTSRVPGNSGAERWEFIQSGLSAFAGRPLTLDDGVYRSEALTNQRNQGIARLLSGYGCLKGDSDETVDVYTRQCSLLVDAHDLSVMGATLADGGVNPVTGKRVVGEQVARDALAVMATAGLYERSGEWLVEIGLPGKSGVAGGLLTVAPGKGAVGSYAPRLDEAGNSVRGQIAAAYLSRALGLNLFASAHDASSPGTPAPETTSSDSGKKDTDNDE
ncbi:glutaminase A [Bifidobacterium crudilactis]|jgi:glutaminase|uniref:Glutaminase n=3 Tax=Bifidobacterium crudilactis TaxID=327277 RepID=A0A971IDI5_9BIFI|nr:glutaminase A [Bifidobacterium crudilactis]MCI1868698.1 glutaminase A [Bifidobacterium crudilactis]MDN5972171.1 glutaminase A [Bifidobacterium crudilactis]MDN6000651.1 glutaminase A [Bifidobacterium crudilactis]MDN6208566.1 glutaminase A [Bifidobacterium crudilactis]MDN6233918.1 glutaminase A [Bifidobacterium crudilactis]